MTGFPNENERRLSAGLPPIPRWQQLDLAGPPGDLEAARDELRRLEALQTERRTWSISEVRAAAAAAAEDADKLDRAVAAARSAGVTWQQIADAVGITRPSAWERWHRG